MAITDLVLQASKTNLNSFVQIVRFLRSSTKFIQNLAIIKKCIFSYDADIEVYRNFELQYFF